MNRLLDYLDPPEDDLIDRLVANVNRALDRQFGKRGGPRHKQGEFDYDPAHDDTKVEPVPEGLAASEAKNTQTPPPPPNKRSAAAVAQRDPDPIIPPPIKPEPRSPDQLSIQTVSAKTAVSERGRTQAAAATMQRSVAEWRSESKSVSIKILVWLFLIMVSAAGGAYWYIFLR